MTVAFKPGNDIHVFIDGTRRFSFSTHTVTVTDNRGYVPCRRKNVWERLRDGGALSEPCHCPFCQGQATVA
jgi:hypothetical protein